MTMSQFKLAQQRSFRQDGRPLQTGATYTDRSVGRESSRTENLMRYSDGIGRDLAAMRSALGLQTIRRFVGQMHWTEESAEAIQADELEPGLKLENVAAHSWQVADATLLLAPQFPDVEIGRAVQLAVLHDKLELITGDLDPVGSDGQGTSSHAFDKTAEAAKATAELDALTLYLATIREPARSIQRELLQEVIECASIEARFVRAIDKLQALTFVTAKKRGRLTDSHLTFTTRYAAKAVQYFPPLAGHYVACALLLVSDVAAYRGIEVGQILDTLPCSVRDLISEHAS